MLLVGISLSIVFLFLVCFLCTLTQIFRLTHKYQAKQFLEEHPYLFFYNKFYDFLNRHRNFNGFFSSCVFAKNIARFGFGASSFLFISELESFKFNWTSLPFILLGLLLIYITISDLFPRLLSLKKAKVFFLFGGVLTSFYLMAIYLIIYPFLKIIHYHYLRETSTPEHRMLLKEKIYDLIQETLPDKNLEANDRMLLDSILNFKQRIVREVMIPRMDVFALPSSTPIKEAVKTLKEENYSRIPIYDDSLDSVSGIVLYKDLFNVYMDAIEKKQLQKLDDPISTLSSKPLYTPETRKISHLLQEFLQKQQHLALVVDEFGAIEGVITTEDLLEEIVGEISDEYDEDEENLFQQHQNSWIVDGRMGLFDIEQNCHVKIPRLGDYDTVGGYIIHRSGSIPNEKLQMSHDDFDLEVLSTTDRQIKKVRITPRVK